MPTCQDGVKNRDKVYANSKTLYCGSNIRFRQGSSGYYFKIMPSVGEGVWGADNKWNVPWLGKKTLTNLGTEKSTACMFTKAQLIDVQTSAK